MQNKLKTQQFMARQGDVLIRQIDAIPDGFKKKKVKGDVILAYGEITNHSHSIKNAKVNVYEMEGEQATIIEVAEALAEVQHQEHAKIPLKKGIYRISIQKEYTPQEIRNVQD